MGPMLASQWVGARRVGTGGVGTLLVRGAWYSGCQLECDVSDVVFERRTSLDAGLAGSGCFCLRQTVGKVINTLTGVLPEFWRLQGAGTKTE